MPAGNTWIAVPVLFFFLVPPQSPKITDLFNFELSQMKYSSESRTEGQPPKCRRDELLAPATPTPKPCRGAGKPPRGALLHTSLQKTPRRAGQSGAPPPQPAFSFKSSRSLWSPLPPSPAAPSEIRNWSWGEWTGVTATFHWVSGAELCAYTSSEGRQGPEALGMKSPSTRPLAQVSKVPKLRETPLILSLGLCSRQRLWWRGKGVWQNKVGEEGRRDCVQFAPK